MSSNPRIEDGWLVAPCAAGDFVKVFMAVGTNEPADPDDWRPAFRDWDASGNRVAKIRLPAGVTGTVTVWLRAGDRVTRLKEVKL